jgi:hypothetical protein
VTPRGTIDCHANLPGGLPSTIFRSIGAGRGYFWEHGELFLATGRGHPSLAPKPVQMSAADLTAQAHAASKAGDIDSAIELFARALEDK